MPDIYRTSALRKAAQITIGLLAVMLIGIICYYREAMLFSDCAHNLFRIIDHNRVEIEASRWGIGISQAFPLVCARLHLPLKVIMAAYAGSFYVLYLLIALLLVYRYRNYGLAVLLGLYVTLLVSDSYYYLNNEGIALLFLVFALNYEMAIRKRPVGLIYLVFIPTFYFAVWTHPLVMMPAIYLWFFFMADKDSWPYSRPHTIMFTVILFVLCLWKFYEGMHHGYDSTKLESLTTFDINKVFRIYEAPQFHFLLRSFVQNYWICSLLFLAGLVALVRERRYWLAFITVGSALAYFVLLCITYWDTESRRFYMEVEYMPLSVITSAPFVYFILPKMSVRAGVVSVVLIFLVRLGYMHHSVAPFRERLELLTSMYEKMKEKGYTKVVLTDMPPDAGKKLIMTWGAPVESMLLSKLQGDVPQRTFIFMDAGQMTGYRQGDKITMIGCWELWTPEKLNSYYFKLDTSRTYQTISYSGLMR